MPRLHQTILAQKNNCSMLKPGHIDAFEIAFPEIVAAAACDGMVFDAVLAGRDAAVVAVADVLLAVIALGPAALAERLFDVLRGKRCEQ